MNKLKFTIGIGIIFICVSCGSSVMTVRNPGKSISRNIRKNAVAHNTRKYKQIKACEEKYIKRFSKIYSNRQNKRENSEISSPFFSSFVYKQ